MLYGKSQNNPASRFIEEIDEELIQSDNQTVASTTLTSKRTRSIECHLVRSLNIVCQQELLNALKKLVLTNKAEYRR